MGILKDYYEKLFPPAEGMEKDEPYKLLARQPLSHHILPSVYDEKNEIYICRDNTLAFMFECFPKPVGGEETLKTLQDIFSAQYLPEKTLLQITLWADDYLEPFVKAFKEYRGNGSAVNIDEKAKYWCDTFGDFFLKHKRRGASDIMQVPMRNFRLFFTCKLPYSYDNYNKNVKEATTALRNIKTALETSYLFPNVVDPDKYVHIMDLIFNPNHDRSIRSVYDPNEYIHKQIISSDTETVIHKRHIKFDGLYGKAVTVKQYPEEVSLIDAMSFIGDASRNELQINNPFMVTLNVTIQGDAAREKQQQKAEFLYKQKTAGALSVKLTKKQEESNWMITKMVEGNRIVKAYVTWWVYDDSLEALTKNVQVLKSLLNMKGYKLQEEIKSMNLAMMLATVPMNLSHEVDEQLLRRNRTMFDFNAAHLSPVQADWKGTGTPVVPFVSRRGQTIFFDLFDGSEGFNAIIAAKTGSGKSFLMNHIIYAYYTLFYFSNIWVIDVGESYKVLCESLNGTYLDFREDANIVINPFSLCTDLNEDMDLFISLIGKMAKPSEKVDDTEKAVIEEAIKISFRAHGNDSNIDTIIDALRRISYESQNGGNSEGELKQEAANLIATNLFRWSSSGAFGKFFNGRNNIDLVDKFVVLELKNLSQRIDLRNVILMVLFYHIYRIVYRDDDRTKKKLLIFDEAWQFMGDEEVASFIENTYRTFRKHNASAITITQGIHDFYKNEHTKEMIFQSAHWMFLMQKEESINILRDENRLAFSDYEFELLTRLRTVKGCYSEIFFSTPMGRGVARLLVPKELYWLYTTDANETAKRDQLIKQYGVKEGIQKCLELHE